METLADRRKRPRFGLKSNIKCRVAGAEDFEEAELENIIEIGTFIWSTQKLAIGTTIYVVIESDNPKDLPVRCTLKVVRESTDPMTDRFGYGCTIEDKTDPNIK